MPLNTECLNCSGGAYIETLSVGTNTLIQPANLKPRIPLGSAQQTGTCSTSSARIFSALASGTLQQIDISLDTVPTSTDTVVIDVLKSTGAGAYASILATTYSMNSSKSARLVYNATISTPAFSAGDIFKVTWTVTGASAADLFVNVHGNVSPA